MIDFLVKFRIPVTVIFFGCQFIWFKSGANLLELQNLSFLAGMSFTILVGFWLLLLIDMINSRMFNKTFWLISMLIMPNLAPVIYLFQRKKLQHISSNSFSRN